MPSVTEDRLRQLEAIERAHDDYLEAMKEVRRRRAQVELEKGPGDYVDGFAHALTFMAEAIVKATQRRHDAGLFVAGATSFGGVLGLG